LVNVTIASCNKGGYPFLKILVFNQKIGMPMSSLLLQATTKGVAPPLFLGFLRIHEGGMQNSHFGCCHYYNL
jgi:hypothetical protein